jgi:hypothetical protein
MFCITIVAFIISLRRFVDKRFKILTVYLFGTLVTDILSVIFDFQTFSAKSSEKRLSILLNVYMLFEYTIFTFFIFLNLVKINKRIFTAFLYCLFILFLVTVWNKYPLSFSKFGPQLFALEGFFILIPCLFYLFELTKLPSLFNLKKQPPFWIIIGSAFYFSITIPCYLLIYNIHARLPEYLPVINSFCFILYSILYLFFIKAFLCPQQTPA